MSTPEAAAAPPTFSWRAVFQLVRLPNVFTAMADVLMGFLFTHGELDLDFADGRLWGTAALLLAASSLLYMAGMVLNDVFDIDVDRVDRPQRPIPSGRVSLRTARVLGFGMLLVGVILGGVTTALVADWRPAGTAAALAVMVLLYDKTLKKTPLAPLAMGACRFLNVLLGMSAAAFPWTSIHFVIAAGLGIYIVGVTWFARTEAHVSNRAALAGASLVMLIGLMLLASLTYWMDESTPIESWPIYAIRLEDRWNLMWAILSGMILWRCVRAIRDPRPAFVQGAVKNCIISLVILDAVVLFAARDSDWAAILLLLLLPTLFLGRWIYST